MIIKRTAIGNSNEAFIEDRYTKGLNIISSDDNNKGKTIVIQSMMFALGNEPTFPTTFNYRDYYHYIEFEVNNTLYQLCRKNNSFILKHNDNLMIFDSVSELKRYWTKHIFPIPQIIKNQISKIVDPVLFLQLFFIGQDKKDTSNISHLGFYNKNDYLNMLFDICNASGIELNEEDIKNKKEQLQQLKDKRSVLIKQHKILKSKKTSISYLSSTNDRIAFEKKIDELEKINDKIATLRKERNVTAIRKTKWENTQKELLSLNRTIDSGELRCMDCNSTNITFSTAKKNGYSFDVTSADIRKEIIESIKEKIEAYEEELEKLSLLIADAQDELKTLMSEENITLESLVMYKEDLFNITDAEIQIRKINEKISNLTSQLQICTQTSQSKKVLQNDILSNISQIMNNTYKDIDQRGNLYFDSLFTKKDVTFSGSEATIFHLVKLYAIYKCLNHYYPIIVDSFRAEDLSTSKEAKVIDLYSNIPNQVIFTTTLKAEELGKYEEIMIVHNIDYTDHIPSKLLTNEYLPEFKQIMALLSINI